MGRAVVFKSKIEFQLFYHTKKELSLAHWLGGENVCIIKGLNNYHGL